MERACSICCNGDFDGDFADGTVLWYLLKHTEHLVDSTVKLALCCAGKDFSVTEFVVEAGCFEIKV